MRTCLFSILGSLLGLFLGVAAALLWLSLKPPLYESSAILKIPPADRSATYAGGSYEASIDIELESKNLKKLIPGDLVVIPGEEKIRSSFDQNSAELEIRVSGQRPEDVQEKCQALALAYQKQQSQYLASLRERQPDVAASVPETVVIQEAEVAVEIPRQGRVACSPKFEPSVMRVPGVSRVYDSHEKKKTYPRTDRQKTSRC